MENQKSPILFAVFSYNRPKLLANLIASTQEFYPDMDRVIFDDKSDSQELLNLYHEYQKIGIKVIFNNNKLTERHGSLYKSMNKALNYSKEHEYPYVFFIQDDNQFLWRDSKFVNHIKSQFKQYPDMLMYSPIFMQKLYLPIMSQRIQSTNNSLEFINMGVADIGIIDTERAQEAELFFSNKGEKYNGEYYYKKGYRLIISFKPYLAWVPWENYYRKNKAKNRFSLLKFTFPYLAYLDIKKIEKLQSNSSVPFIEDYTYFHSKWFFKPYKHGISFKLYLKYLFRYYFSVLF